MKRTYPVLALALALGAVAIYGAATLLTTDAVEEKAVRVAEGSYSFVTYGWGEGDAFSPAPPDFYRDPSTATDRPLVITDVVVHESLSEAVGLRTTHFAPSGRGMGMGTLRSENSDASPLVDPQEFQLNSGEEFRLDLGQEFAFYLLFSAHSPTETSFLITALVDYEQVEFTLDGMTGLLHEIRMPVDTEMIMPINLGALPPGAHDIEIIIFDDPYRGYDLAIEGPSNRTPESGDLIVFSMSQRHYVIVDDNDQPARSLQVQYSGSTPPPDVSLGMLAFFAKPGEAHPMKPESQIAVDVGEADGEYRFRTWTTRHENFVSGRQAIMMFVDYHLVPVNGNDLLMVELEAGEEAIIDSVVFLPDGPGVHQLLAFVVLDPYTPKNGGRLRGPYSESSSFKLAINAR